MLMAEVSSSIGQRGTRESGSRLVELSPNFTTERDRILIAELQEKSAKRNSYTTPWGLTVRNRELGPLVQRHYTPDTFAALTSALLDLHTLDIHPTNGKEVTIDGQQHFVTIVPATETQTHGDMSEQVWIRDETLDARSIIEALKVSPDRESVSSKEQEAKAKSIIIGAIDLMSTGAQIRRFENLIEYPKLADNHELWPQITINTDHLDSEVPTPWRHNQEAFQMLGITTLDAIDAKVLELEDLAGDNKKFLTSMMPFLASVNFSERENVGSWEEVPAMRTSVIGIETMLLHMIRERADRPEFAFMQEGFETAKEHLLKNKDRTSFNGTDFNAHTSYKDALDMMIDKGLERIGEQLPHETPDYGPDSAKTTGSDAALIYLLDYDVPKLLADKHIPMKAAGGVAMERDEIENIILAEVGKLYDEETQGIRRYGAPGEPNPDTYLRTPWYNTPGVQSEISNMKQTLKNEAEGGPINLERKRKWRAEIVPEGPSSAWTHFNAQISAWAGRRYLETGSEFYLNTSTETFNRWISMVTDNGEHTILSDGKGGYSVVSVDAGRIPECISFLELADGKKLSSPSPNTQLDWGVMEGFESVAIMGAAIQKQAEFFAHAA